MFNPEKRAEPKSEKEENGSINETHGEMKEIVEDSIEQEEKPELIPTKEDVKFVFEKLLKVENYENIRKLKDEQGLYLWEIKVSEKDGYTEYSYMRKGIYPQGQALDTAVHIVFFDEEDFPISGSSVAKYIEGEWKLTP